MRRLKSFVSVSAVIALVVGVGAAGAGAASRSASATQPADRPLPAVATGSRAMVTLVTGDRVVVTTLRGGRTADTFLPAAGHSSEYQSLSLRGDSYLVPRDAMADLGRRWVLADFDLTRLAAGLKAPAAPSTPRRQAAGYRDILSSPATSGRSTSSGYKLEVLTLKGINDAGAPDTDDSVILINLENTELYTAFLFFDGKPIKLQVPVGHYAAIGTFFNFGSSGPGAAQSVVVPQVDVDAATTLTVDARTADDPVKLSLPVPATVVDGNFTVLRTALKGSFSDGIGTEGNQLVEVNPTPPPSIGSLKWMPQWHEVAKSGNSTYDVLLTENGIPSDETFTPGPSGLAAVRATYASDGPTRHGYEAVFGFTPSDPFSFSDELDLARPTARTEYYSTGTGVAWSHELDTADPFSISDVSYFDFPQSYPPGHAVDAWLTGPLAPATPVAVAGTAAPFSTFYCAECRTADTLDLDVVPWGDSTAGHLGFANGLEKSSFSLHSGSVELASGRYPEGAFPVSAAPSVYTLNFTDQRTTPTWLTSTRTATTWVFASAAGASDLPAHWLCPTGGRDCSTVSLLFPRYTLPTNLQSEEGPGSTGFVLGFDHDDEPATVPVGTPHVSVSFDGGSTWTAATVRALGGDKSLITYANPTPAGAAVYASLRVSGTDSAGASVNQTVRNAYAVSSGS